MTALTSVATTEKLCKELGYRAIIVVGVRSDGVIDVMSAGRSKADCKIIGDYAQNQFGDHIPAAPFQTWFGWGHAGVPTKLRQSEQEALSAGAQRYVEANTPKNARRHPDDLLIAVND